jgi:N-acetylmuramoyl-L-alanine amidase
MRAMKRFGGILALSLAAVLSAAGARLAQAETADQSAPKCARADFRVVLDVGHTAESPGAKSARGVDEYAFNLRLAKVIDQALRDAGFAKTVLMVTGGPGIRSMYVRVARANTLEANLLLSIHHDSVPNLFIEKWEYEGRPEIFSDRFTGHSLFVSDDNADPKDSLMFAAMLGRQLKARGLQYTPHYTEAVMGRWRRNLLDADAGVYRYDTLFVLKKTRMPAALLEAGSIVNRDEEVLLASPERQQLISAAVVDAIDGFCAAHVGKPAVQIAHAAPRAISRAVTQTAHLKRRHSLRRTAEATPAAAARSNLDMH